MLGDLHAMMALSWPIFADFLTMHTSTDRIANSLICLVAWRNLLADSARRNCLKHLERPPWVLASADEECVRHLDTPSTVLRISRISSGKTREEGELFKAHVFKPLNIYQIGNNTQLDRWLASLEISKLSAGLILGIRTLQDHHLPDMSELQSYQWHLIESALQIKMPVEATKPTFL